MDADGAERYFPWDVLELDPTRDQRAIKRAYARLLRKNNPEDDAAGFQRLREAFERAQQEAKWIDLEPWRDEQPSETPSDTGSAASSGQDVAYDEAKEKAAVEAAAAELHAALEQAEIAKREGTARERAALRIEPAEPEPGEAAPPPAEPALRVEPASEPEPPSPAELWQGPERPALAVELAPEIAAAVASADPFDELCAAAEKILGDHDAAATEHFWQDLLHGIDRAGIDARRRFGDWLFERLHKFDISRPWGNPSFHGIPREVWLTLDRQFGWAADEIKLAARHGEEAIVSVMGAVRRARGERAEAGRVVRAPDPAEDADKPGKTPWWVWWLVIWGIIALIRVLAK